MAFHFHNLFYLKNNALCKFVKGILSVQTIYFNQKFCVMYFDAFVKD